MKYVIVYNLIPNETFKCYLVESLICSMHPDGRLKERYKLATKTTLEGLSSVTYADTPHVNLINKCINLELHELAAKYKPKGKRKPDIASVLDNPKTKELCYKHIYRTVNEVLSTCREYGFPVTHNLVRKTSAEDLRLRFSTDDYTTKVRFVKTDEGIDYSLVLQQEDTVVYPSAVYSEVINNNPGWVMLGNNLVQLKDVNGNKLKPFLSKKVIKIPDRISKNYFEKFILDMVSRVVVEAEGFDIIDKNTLVETELKMTQNLFSGEWLLSPTFHYNHHSFSTNSKSTYKTAINFLTDDKIVIIYQRRNLDAEKRVIQSLTDLGLHISDTGNLSLEGGDRTSLHRWVVDNRENLNNIGFRLRDTIKMGDKLININSYDLQVNYQKDNDWFDIGGYIRVGTYDISFVDLLNNIKEEDPYYLMPDGTIFLIPEEWMAKYAAVVKLGKFDEKRFKLQKSNFGLLEELDAGEVAQGGRSPLLIEDYNSDYIPSNKLKATLRPYQLEGVRWLINLQHNGLGACLADDMGLGKTLQVIALLSYTAEQESTDDSTTDSEGQLSMFAREYLEENSSISTLVVVPASLIFNWLKELQKFAPHLRATSYIGAKRKSRKGILDLYDVVVTTYQTALRDIDILKKKQWTYVVLDESQYIKNRNSKIFKALSDLNTECKISLSGTPIENSLADLWSQMEFINPEILGTYEFFKNNFQIPIEKENSEAAITDLKRIVNPFLLRRTKQEVATDLPELHEQIIHVDMSEEQIKKFEERKSAARNMILDLDESDKSFKFHVFKELMALRQIANHPALQDSDYKGDSGKLELIVHKATSLIKSSHKLLIFSSFTSYLDLIKERLEAEGLTCSYLTGSTSQAKRKQEVNAFQSGKRDIFLISIKAGGVGLNLTTADYVFIVDPWWNPFIERQAVARAHRIGQENPVHVIKYVSRDSIEEKILILQDKKLQLHRDIIDSEQPHLTFQEFKDLLV